MIGQKAKLSYAPNLEKVRVAGIVLSRVLDEFLNKTQKQILSAVIDNKGKNATQLVNSFNLPKSTVWHNLRKLRALGLVDFGEERAVKLNPAVAQLVERSAVAREAAGASPARGTSGVDGENI